MSYGDLTDCASVSVARSDFSVSDSVGLLACVSHLTVSPDSKSE